MDARRLDVRARLWTLTMLGHSVPFVLVAVGLFWAEPLSFPVGLIALVHAWAIPELYAKRGANVLNPARARGRDETARETAVGLLADLVAPLPADGVHAGRRRAAPADTGGSGAFGAVELYRATGLVVERGALGVWVLGEAGAVLVRPGGRRAHCFCVRVEDPDLPPADRTAHLLLALREDEAGFATVANGAFAGAPWRIRRRMRAHMRPGLDAGVAAARR